MRISEIMRISTAQARRKLVSDICASIVYDQKKLDKLASLLSIEDEPEHYWNMKGNKYISLAGKPFMRDYRANNGHLRILTPYLGFVCDEGLFLDYDGDDLKTIAYHALNAIMEHIWTDQEETFCGNEEASQGLIEDTTEGFESAYSWLQNIFNISQKGE